MSDCVEPLICVLHMVCRGGLSFEDAIVYLGERRSRELLRKMEAYGLVLRRGPSIKPSPRLCEVYDLYAECINKPSLFMNDPGYGVAVIHRCLRKSIDIIIRNQKTGV